MARFPEAERRLFRVKICKKCKARNAWLARKCRKCCSKALRPKRKEAKG